MKDKTIQKIFSALANDRGRKILHKAQDKWLREQIAYAAKQSPFYRDKFSSEAVDIKRIKTVADLPKLGFFTYPSDLQTDPFEFLAVPRNEILYAMSSSGTTGESKVVFLTKNDWLIATRSVGNGLSMMGVREDDVVQILFCFGTPSWMTGSVLQSGLERLGAFVLPTGNSIPIKKQIEIIQKFKSTILIGTPSYLHRLTEEGSHFADLRSLGIRLIRLGAEPWSESFREYLEQEWGAAVYDSYGMMELGAVGAGECKAKSGLHLSPYILTEVIDPDTGQQVRDGEIGELVYTLVKREGSPLIRYRSGDLGRFLPNEVCPCSEIPTDRISRLLGRSDDMLFLGSGENAYPSHFDSALVGIEGLSTYQVIIEKDGYMDQMTIRIEKNINKIVDESSIIKRLYNSLPFLEYEINQSRMIAPLKIDIIPSGTLVEESPVKVRPIIDRRNHRE